MVEPLRKSAGRIELNPKEEIAGNARRYRPNGEKKPVGVIHRPSDGSNRWMDLALNHISDAVIRTDHSLKIAYLNASAEMLTGWPSHEAVGKPMDVVVELSVTDVMARITAMLTSCGKESAPFTIPHRTLLLNRHEQLLFITGQVIPVDSGGDMPSGVMIIFQDSSETIQLQKELVRAQKFESLGVLAGGISHDFNNILTSLGGNLELAMLASAPVSPVYRKLELVEKALRRAGDLNRQLMMFSKGSDLIRKPSHVRQLLNDAIDLTLQGKSIRWELEVENGIAPIHVDEGQMNQVITNLLINARQAMPEGGTIRITAKNTMVQQGTQLPLPPGRYIRITVSDQGDGIPSQIASKVFDPYFTTKPSGNGLGLSTAYRIVKDHSGHIEVSSIPNTGSRFHVYLPALPMP